MSFEEFSGELDQGFAEFTGELDAPDTGDETARLASRYKAPREAVPDMTAGSVAQDAFASALAIGPTALKGVGELASMTTGGRVGQDFARDMQGRIDTVTGMVGSERGAAQKRNFQRDMADDSVGIGDALMNNKGAMLDMALPSLGSMLLPVGAAGAATKLATVGKVAQGLDKAALAARVASAQQAAGIGATVAQNAASTFSELVAKGESLQDAYIAAGITVPFSLIAGKLTGGGAEGALIKGMGGKAGAAEAIKRGAIEVPKAMIREGGQEVGEEAGQITGEAVGTGKTPSFQNVAKQLAVAGTMGGVVGGGVNFAQQALESGAPSATDQERAKLEKLRANTADAIQQQQVGNVLGATNVADAAQAAVDMVNQSPTQSADQLLSEAGIAKPDTQAMMAELEAEIDPTAPIAPVSQMAAQADEVVGEAAAAPELTVPEKGSAVIPSVETGQSMVERLLKPTTPEQEQTQADTVVAEKAKSAPAYTPAFPQPGQAEGIVNKALESARKNADLADERLYSVEALQRIAAHPQANAELKSAATNEVQRRAGIEQVKQQQFEAQRSGTVLSIPDAPPLRPLSVERGMDLMREKRPLLPQEQGYLTALRGEMGGDKFAELQTIAKAPFMYPIKQRMALIKPNRDAIEAWDAAHNKPAPVPAQQATQAPQAAQFAAPKVTGLAAEKAAVSARTLPSVQMNIAPALQAAQAPAAAPTVKQDLTVDAASGVATNPAQTSGKGKKGKQKQEVDAAEEGGDKPKWWASQIGNATPAATHTAPEPYVQQLNSAVPSLAPDTNPSKETRRGANSIPTFQGGKTKMARAITDKVRQHFGGNAAKIDTIIDYFGGSGSWGAYMASSVFTNTKSLVIHEYNPERLSKIKLFNERGDQIASMLKNAKVVAFFDKIKKVIAEKETYSGSAIAGVVAHREAYKKLIAEANAEIGADAMDGLLQAIEDQGQASFGLYGDGKTAESAVNDILRLVSLNGAQAHTQMSALRARGVSISYVTGDSYQAQQVQGKNVLAMVDPPYYATKGYNGVNKVPIETYNETRKLLDRLRTAGNSVIYTDEAWWEKHDKNGKTDVPADLNKQVDGLDAFGQLRGIQSLMGDFFRMPIASRMEVVGLIDGNQNAGTVTATTSTDARTDARRDVRQDARGMDTGTGQQASGNVAQGNGRVSQGQTSDAGIKASRAPSALQSVLGYFDYYPVAFPIGYKDSTPKDIEIGIADIVPTQDSLKGSAVEQYARDDGGLLPEVVLDKSSGRYILLDGHHRVAGAVVRGDDTVQVTVVGSTERATAFSGFKADMQADWRASFPGDADRQVLDVVTGEQVGQGADTKRSVTKQSPRTPVSTLRAAITKAYGNLLTRLEGKGLVSLTQTEEEAIAAAAQARADQNGGDVEAIKKQLRASVLASQRAWHGTPHRGIEKFSTDNIGTGEGAQAFGYGLYYADRQELAEGYRKKLSAATYDTPTGNKKHGEVWQSAFDAAYQTGGISNDIARRIANDVTQWIDEGRQAGTYLRSYSVTSTLEPGYKSAMGALKGVKKAQGQLYEVDIPNDSDMLLWDKPLSEQPESVRKALANAKSLEGSADIGMEAADMLRNLSQRDAGTEQAFSKLDIPSKRLVLSGVRNVLNNLKVRQSVVGLVPVDVVDILAGKQLSSKALLDNPSMLLDLLPANGNDAVSMNIDRADAAIRAIALAARTEGLLVQANPVRVPENLVAAVRAGKLDQVHGYQIYRMAERELGSAQDASEFLKNVKVAGIKYLDGQSRADGDGSYNYVVFSGDDVQIVDVKYSTDGNLEGFFDPATGKSFLIADNLTAESAPATLMHEVGIHMAADGKLEPLFKRAATLLKMGRNNPFIQRVQSRMDESGETSAEEAAAYIVTEYEKDRTNAPQSVVKWMADLMADVRAWLFSKGVIIKASQLTVADIAAVARANARSIANDGKASTEVADKATVFNSKKDGQDGFWQRLAGGDSFSATEYVSALEGDMRNEGFGSFRGRTGFSSGLGTHLAHWRRPIAGFSDYYSLAVKDSGGDFNVLAIPAELVSNNQLRASELHDLAVSRFTIFRNKFGKLELAVSEPDQGTTAYKALQARGTVKLSDQWTANGDHQYSRVDIGSAEMRKLVRETVRRYAMTYGDIEDVLIPRRDTGANTERLREFSRDDIRLRFSRQKSRPTVGNNFTIEAESTAGAARRKMQDSFIQVKRVQDQLVAQGGKVTEASDVYRGEERSHGIVEEALKDFRREMFDPMIEGLAKAKLNADELALFAYAKHAPERNDHIASINPKLPDGGSGMTNQEAADIIAAFTKEGKLADLEAAHKQLMAITAKSRQRMLSGGLISQAQFDAMEDQFDNYVPLRGWENDDTDQPVPRGGGRGFSIRGKETMRALGRTTRAADLLENVFTDYERVVNRAERNAVAQQFLQLVMDNPDSGLWEIDKRKTKFAWDQMKQGAKSVSMVDTTGAVAVKIDGKPVYIQVNDPLLLRAMNAESDAELTGARRMVSWMGMFNSFLRASLTQYNPVFAATNYARDAGMGLVGAVDELGFKGAASYAKYHGLVWGAAHRFTTGKLDLRNPLDKLFNEYRLAGGTTGGFYAKDADQVRGEIRNVLLAAGAKPETMWEKVKTVGGTTTLPMKGVQAAGSILEHMGQLTENVTRFAAYCAARDAGKTVAQASSIAKNLTVNFNRKGEYGAIINSLYLFFNASVQGSATVLKTIKNPKVQGMLVGMVAAGFALAGAGGDDEDGQKYWDKIPDYEKERNLIIMLPDETDVIAGVQTVGKRGRYIKIPMAYGFNTFVVMGYALKDAMRHHDNPQSGIKPKEAFKRVLGSVMGSFNPMGGSIDPENASSVVQAVLPTLMDVVYQQASGVNSFSRNTAPPKRDDDVRPDSENATVRQTGGLSHKVARLINEATGGDKVTKGAIDIAPGTIDNAVRSMTGGLGVFVFDTFSAIGKINTPGVETTVKDIPFVRNFLSQVDDANNTSLMYERIRESKEASDQVRNNFKLNAQSGNIGQEQYQLAAVYKASTGYTKALRHIRLQELVISDSDASKSEKNIRLQELRKQREALANSFNQMYLAGTKRVGD